MSKDSDKPHAMQPEDTPELRALYRGFEELLLYVEDINY